MIDHAGTGARVASLPRRTTIAAMRLASALKLSPLGPYHWRMIAEDFVFDLDEEGHPLEEQEGAPEERGSREAREEQAPEEREAA